MSKALQANPPTIVTRVLLLDQRFWGSRCKTMGVGPFGVHVNDFPNACVGTIDQALTEGSEWQRNAKDIGTQLLEEARGNSLRVAKERPVFCNDE